MVRGRLDTSVESLRPLPAVAPGADLATSLAEGARPVSTTEGRDQVVVQFESSIVLRRTRFWRSWGFCLALGFFSAPFQSFF
jgi:hypothetical protein